MRNSSHDWPETSCACAVSSHNNHNTERDIAYMHLVMSRTCRAAASPVGHRQVACTGPYGKASLSFVWREHKQFMLHCLGDVCVSLHFLALCLSRALRACRNVPENSQQDSKGDCGDRLSVWKDIVAIPLCIKAASQVLSGLKLDATYLLGRSNLPALALRIPNRAGFPIDWITRNRLPDPDWTSSRLPPLPYRPQGGGLGGGLGSGLVETEL
ncbi:hypothetical protein GGR57DRAFT_424493 [Xylariaceae sp. FL1272]|nr:hypothetical protein GGR57DRAFT_424493 [Xylariaceae sp. FL1272]